MGSAMVWFQNRRIEDGVQNSPTLEWGETNGNLGLASEKENLV